MKTRLSPGLCVLLAGLIAFPALAIFVAPPSGKVTLVWSYSTNELSTNLTFNLYSTTNLATPLADWECLTNIPGTNLSTTIQIEPGRRFFVLTASNFWGESVTSNIAFTPPLPRHVEGSLTIRRGE